MRKFFSLLIFLVGIYNAVSGNRVDCFEDYKRVLGRGEICID